MHHRRHSCTGWGAILIAAIAVIATDARADGVDRPIAPATARADEDPGASVGTPIAAPSGSLTGDAVRTVVALGAVLALALLMRQVARRFSDPLAARRPSGVVQILSRFPVGKGQTVQLLAVGTRVLCVHQAAGRMSTLCEFTDPQEIALLRTRIEAGSAGRERFEGELTRSLERDTTTLGAGRRGNDPRMPLPTETIDLTKRRPQGQRPGGLALAGGGRA